jgi:hypothetical protein
MSFPPTRHFHPWLAAAFFKALYFLTTQVLCAAIVLPPTQRGLLGYRQLSHADNFISLD